MRTRADVIRFCLKFENAYEDYPFKDKNWTVIRHKSNKKGFAWIFKKDGNIWVNVKNSPEWCDFRRRVFGSVLPAYHMNKTHWNSVILDGTVPDENIAEMICESYDLTL